MGPSFLRKQLVVLYPLLINVSTFNIKLHGECRYFRLVLSKNRKSELVVENE